MLEIMHQKNQYELFKENHLIHNLLKIILTVFSRHFIQNFKIFNYEISENGGPLLVY